MNNIYKLIKAAYYFRKDLKRCLKHNVNSNEYRLAKHYKDYFEREKSDDLTKEEIAMLTNTVNHQKIEHEGSEDIQCMFSSMLIFLDILTPVSKHA